jgi:RHH-type rel operon transcriptional repressor/antitoxin RelB
MIAVRLPKPLDDRLSAFAEKTHRSKSYYIRKAIEAYLQDHEDYLLALSRLEEKNPRISLDEAVKKLGLED